jgi:hypothetical protein
LGGFIIRNRRRAIWYVVEFFMFDGNMIGCVACEYADICMCALADRRIKSALTRLRRSGIGKSVGGKTMM